MYICHASCSVYIICIVTANCGPLHTHLPWLGPAWSTSGSAGPAASKRDCRVFLIMVIQQDSMKIYPVNTDLIFQSRPIIVGIPCLDHMTRKRSNTEPGFLFRRTTYWGEAILELKKNRKVVIQHYLTLFNTIFYAFLCISIFLGGVPYSQIYSAPHALLWGGGQVAEPGSVMGTILEIQSDLTGIHSDPYAHVYIYR